MAWRERLGGYILLYGYGSTFFEDEYTRTPRHWPTAEAAQEWAARELGREARLTEPRPEQAETQAGEATQGRLM